MQHLGEVPVSIAKHRKHSKKGQMVLLEEGAVAEVPVQPVQVKVFLPYHLWKAVFLTRIQQEAVEVPIEMPMKILHRQEETEEATGATVNEDKVIITMREQAETKAVETEEKEADMTMIIQDRMQRFMVQEAEVVAATSLRREVTIQERAVPATRA